MKKKGKTGARALANPHEPVPQECAASDLAQSDESSSALRVKISEKNGVPQMHAHILLMEALGTTDLDFLDGILCQLLNVGSRVGKLDERGLNFLLSVIKGVKPRVATSKRTRERCKAPAVRGWTVCRFHGARGGGPRGKRNGMFKHGLYTKEAVQERRLLRELLRQSRRMLST